MPDFRKARCQDFSEVSKDEGDGTEETTQLAEGAWQVTLVTRLEARLHL